MRLANVQKIELVPGGAPTPKTSGTAVAVGSGFEVRVPLAGVVDMAGETARIAKELAKIEADMGGLQKKLGNPSFVEKAPREVIEKDQARLEELTGRKQKLEAHRTMLTDMAGGGLSSTSSKPSKPGKG